MKGHLKKRSNGSWSIVIELGRDPHGKRRQAWHTVRGTKKQAQEELTRLLHQMQTGEYVEAHRLTVQDYLERWLDAYAKPHVSTKSYARYAGICRGHLIPALGNYPLAKLTPLHIEGCLASARESGRLNGEGALSEQTLLHHHRVLKLALKTAIKWRLMVRNPADAVAAPRPVRHEMRALNEQETMMLLDAAKGARLYVPLVVTVTTGLRRGELLALRWQDVDLDRGTIAVRQALEQTCGLIQFKKPKTRKSQRTIALLSITVEALRAHKVEQKKLRLLVGPAYEDQGLIFARQDGSVWPPNGLTSSFRKLIKKVGLGALRFHDLRHSHATQLLRQGVHPKVVSERLGHASIAITLDTYSHVLPGIQEEAAIKLDIALRAAMPLKS